jgi:predicted GNAT family acetyltransferase
MRERLYRLDAVVQPPAPPGAWRLAEPGDGALIDRWSTGFAEDTGVESGESIGRDLASRVGDGRVFLWVDGGEPVSLTATAQPIGGVVRVGPVYTPPDRRGRGFASALVAVVSQHALDAGNDCCTLFTDLDNPTSNRIYQAVGYRPICDVGMHEFTISEP